MVEPEKSDQRESRRQTGGDFNSPVTRGVLIATTLFIVAFLTMMILAQNYESDPLVSLLRVLWYLLGFVFLLWWVTVGTIRFFKRQIQERRDRAERNEGLNGPSNQRKR